jgi:hypothetical protein
MKKDPASEAGPFWKDDDIKLRGNQSLPQGRHQVERRFVR